MKALPAGFALLLLTLVPASADDTATPPGPVVGIGAEIKITENHPVVAAVVPGNAASKAGIRAGDRLLEIDGKSVDGMSLSQVADRLRGATNTHVHVVIMHPGADHPKTFILRRQVVALISSEGEPVGK